MPSTVEEPFRLHLAVIRSLRRFRPIGSMGIMLLVVGTTVSNACRICLPFPAESLADRVLAAEHLILAREKSGQPFTLGITSILWSGGGAVPPIELFLDSSTRRRLSLDEDLHVLCGWMPGEGEWRQLTLHDEATAPVVRDILRHRDAWATDPGARADYFADHLASRERVLADLAHIEVARTPYAQLTGYADRVPREELLRRIGNMRRMDWHALYILLLAQSGHEADHQFIRERVESAAQLGSPVQVAAWATALIEIDGLAGVERLAKLYLEGEGREPEEYAAVHAGLRVHGDQGSPLLRDAIVASYGRLLEHYPPLAVELADDLTRWGCYEHASQLAKCLDDDRLDLVARMRIRKHLRLARAAADPLASGSAAVAKPLVSHGMWLFVGLLLVPLGLALWGRRHQPGLSIR